MLLFSITALLLASSSLGHYTSLVTNIVDPSVQVDYDNTTNYFPDQINSNSQAMFTVEYHPSYKYLHNKIFNQTYVLYQRGTPKPKPHSPSDTFLEIPLDKVGIISSGIVPYFEILGLYEHVAYIGYLDSIPSSCILKYQPKYKIPSFPHMFLDSMDEASKCTNFASSIISSSTIAVDDSGVSDVLQTTEWLEFYSVFFNMEKAANIFNRKLISNYNCIKKSATSRVKNPKPVVAWASAFTNMNVTLFEISLATNKYNLTVDAGASMIDLESIDVPLLKRKDNAYYIQDGSIIEYKPSIIPGIKPMVDRQTYMFKKITDIHKVLKNVDILIDETNVLDYRFFFHNNPPTFKSVLKWYGLNESDTQFKFIKNKAIFRPDRIGGRRHRSWDYENTVMADLALEEVINVIYPDFHKGYNFRWMRNVYSDAMTHYITAEDCKDPKVPRSELTQTCNLSNSEVLADPPENQTSPKSLRPTTVMMWLLRLFYSVGAYF